MIMNTGILYSNIPISALEIPIVQFCQKSFLVINPWARLRLQKFLKSLTIVKPHAITQKDLILSNTTLEMENIVGCY